jgi:hypothetical protein
LTPHHHGPTLLPAPPRPDKETDVTRTGTTSQRLERWSAMPACGYPVSSGKDLFDPRLGGQPGAPMQT